MTVYGPDIEQALQTYATQFDDIRVQKRTPLVELNAINPLSDLRENYQNVTSNQTEHHLSTSANTDEIAYLETVEHGQYTAGYEAQAGIGVRIPTLPSKDETIRWGYFSDDPATTEHEPNNGWYFGVDSDGVFVAEIRSSSINQKVYQQNWNTDTMMADDHTKINPSDKTLDLSKGNIFQIEFVYYGYGPVKMQVLTDDGKVTVHRFTHDGQTSVENTNLPIEASIDNGSTNSDALDMFVGGRQFSIIGQEGANERRAGHYIDSVSGIDDTQWYHIISMRIKDGTDIGSIDYTHLTCSVLDFELDTDNSGYRWQIRRGTVPDNPTWETPSSHVQTANETAMKVDTNSTDIQDGSGNLTGVFVDGGTLDSGGNNTVDIQQESPSGDILGGEVVSLVIRAVPGSSGTISEIFQTWEEKW